MSRSALSSADAISARLRDLELLTKGPAWALTRSAPWVIAVLQASFTRTRPQLPLEQFHADVDAFLEQLRRQDPGLGGAANGKTFGDEWTRKNFLTRRNQSGQIVYEVTEPAARFHRLPGEPFQRTLHAQRVPARDAAGRRREACQ